MSKETVPRSWSLLCSVCGTCSVLCPSGIRFKYDRLINDLKPVVIKECIDCEVREKVCPSLVLQGSEYSSNITDLVGNYRNIYVGYTTNVNLRWMGSS